MTAPHPVAKFALFNEPLGDAHLHFFAQMGIAVVWRSGDSWSGSEMARAAELC